MAGCSRWRPRHQELAFSQWYVRVRASLSSLFAMNEAVWGNRCFGSSCRASKAGSGRLTQADAGDHGPRTSATGHPSPACGVGGTRLQSVRAPVHAARSASTQTQRAGSASGHGAALHSAAPGPSPDPRTPQDAGGEEAGASRWTRATFSAREMPSLYHVRLVGQPSSTRRTVGRGYTVVQIFKRYMWHTTVEC